MSASRQKPAAGRGIRRAPGGGETPRRPRIDSGEEAHIPWGKRNFLILSAGAGAVVLGFIFLAVGDKVFSPILIVGGYLGLIPWGILAADRKGRSQPPPLEKAQGEGE
jgi:hypothetical protein